MIVINKNNDKTYMTALSSICLEATEVKLGINEKLLIELGICPDMKGFSYISIGIDLCVFSFARDIYTAIATEVSQQRSVVVSSINNAFKKVELNRLNYLLEKYDMATFEALPSSVLMMNLLAVIAVESMN